MKVKEVLQSIVLFGMMYLALAMAFIMDATKKPRTLHIQTSM